MQHLQPNTTLQGGKYRIEQVLGQGGFGITYLAEQTSLHRYVAIKELFIGGSGQAINDRKGNYVVVTNYANQAHFDQQRVKFKKEAIRLANLNHANLAKVHDFFEENGTAYYVMDYINGESLRTKLNREGRLSENVVLKYLQQLLPALEVAHIQSIWHLDIKPENILIDRNNNVFLIDFGASKHIEHNSALTTSLALAYTPGYCPPELADLTYGNQDSFVQALKDIGPWTDIYALGATMYNLLTESIPPSSNRLYRDGRNAFMFPSDISISTKNLIVQMMMPNREDRPQSMKDLFLILGNESLINEDNVYISKDISSKKVNFVLLDKSKINESEATINADNGLLTDWGINNITWDNDIIDSNLLDNLCRKYNHQSHTEQEVFVEDISKETNNSIGIVLIHLGWLMKEGKVNDSWNLYINNTRINGELVGFSAGDVFQVLASASYPISIDNIIEENSKQNKFAENPLLGEGSMEATLLGLGWLMKEGRLLFENNLISLS